MWSGFVLHTLLNDKLFFSKKKCIYKNPLKSSFKVETDKRVSLSPKKCNDYRNTDVLYKIDSHFVYKTKTFS